MARIKSAFELAMERIEDIEIDPQQIRKDRLTQTGKRIAGTYLISIDKSIEDVQEDVATLPEEDRDLVRDVMIDTALNNITLPQNDRYVQHIGKVKSLLTLLAGKDDGLLEVFVQIDNLYNQYLEMRQQTYDQLVGQFTPRLQQKQQLLQQQTGQTVDIEPELDKEFMEMLNQTYSRLDQQVLQVLGQIKDALRELI